MADNVIELRHLTKTYNSTTEPVTALKNIDLQIGRGEIYGIIGLSGAGKTTLVRCINLLEIPTEGEVIFDGKDLTKLKASQLRRERRKISMIFQQFNLLEQRTVLKNVTFPLELNGTDRRDAKEKAMELLRMVGLEERADSYPSQLSGGQKQRVAIARALASDPQVILCDEATSALDPETTKQILALLRKINRELGVTVVVITHEMTVIEAICDKVAIIDHAGIVEKGTVEEIFAGPKTEIGRRLIMSGNVRAPKFTEEVV